MIVGVVVSVGVGVIVGVSGASVSVGGFGRVAVSLARRGEGTSTVGVFVALGVSVLTGRLQAGITADNIPMRIIRLIRLGIVFVLELRHYNPLFDLWEKSSL